MPTSLQDQPHSASYGKEVVLFYFSLVMNLNGHQVQSDWHQEVLVQKKLDVFLEIYVKKTLHYAVQGNED